MASMYKKKELRNPFISHPTLCFELATSTSIPASSSARSSASKSNGVDSGVGASMVFMRSLCVAFTRRCVGGDGQSSAKVFSVPLGHDLTADLMGFQGSARDRAAECQVFRGATEAGSQRFDRISYSHAFGLKAALDPRDAPNSYPRAPYFEVRTTLRGLPSS